MESPEFIHLIGKGIFLLDVFTIESPFLLYLNPYRIRVVVEEVEQATLYSLYKLFSSGPVIAHLTGTLNDGRSINARALHLTALPSIGSPPAIGSPPGVEFTAAEGISFGQARDTSPTESRYPLTGYFDGALTLVHDGWNINTIPCQNPYAARALAKNWRLPVEGTVLQLRREDSTMDQHRDFSRIVMTLLSIASGTGVSCDRHFFTWANEELEIWSHWTGDEIGPGPIVPDFEVGRFLEQTLPAWQSLSQNQRNAVHLARDYINLSALGYLDTRLFRIVQPWEFLAEAWGIQGVLSNSEACLRSGLLQAEKKWNADHPNSDIDRFWGSRISSIFDWPKLRDAIEQLAASFGLNLKQVGFDLDLLKKARDSVAHSGKLPEHPTRSNRQSFDLLTSGQYCLQLLLLRMLAYQGRVYHSTGGHCTFVDIDQALTTVRT